MKKTRADSKIDALPAPARAALTQWLFEDNLSYAKCDERLQSEFSCSVGRTALSQFFQRQGQQRMLDRIASGRIMAEGLQTELRATAPLLEESTLQLISQRAFDLAIAQQTDIDGLATLTQLLLKARKQAMDEKSLALDREKFESAWAEKLLKISDTLAAKAAELNASSLSQGEKIAAMRQAAFADVEAMRGKIQFPT